MRYFEKDKVSIRDNTSQEWVILSVGKDTCELQEVNPITLEELESYEKNGQSLADFEPETTTAKPEDLILIKNHAEEILELKKTGDLWKDADKQNELDELRDRVYALLSDKRTRQAGVFELANYCLVKFDIITLEETDEIYTYSDGVYLPYGTKIIGAHIQKHLGLGNLITTHVINECFGHVRRSTYRKLSDLNEDPHRICLANGILNLETLTVEPHNPTIVFFNKLPVAYDTKQDCSEIKKFLGQVVEEDSIPVLQELVGYTLFKGHHIHKAFMLVGSGANGKSTFINVLRALIGPQNCSSVPLHQLENNRFAISSLFGKLTNIFADLPARALKETAMFKILTGEDLVHAEKKFKDYFFFTNYAKLIFSCNQIPRSPDDSDAFFRRWIIITFPHQFTGSTANNNLIKELTTPKELSGLLNYAIEGLKRLLEQGNFSSAQSIESTREAYIRKSDSVGAFSMDRILTTPDQHVAKKELYTTYCDYCRDLGYPIVPENTFHRQLQAVVRVEDYRPRVNGLRVQCWKGISLTREPENIVDHPDTPDQTVNNVSDVKVENTPNETKSIAHVQDVYNFIREQGNVVQYKDLLERVKEDTKNPEQFVNTALEVYRSRGDIFEVQPGRWRTLE